MNDRLTNGKTPLLLRLLRDGTVEAQQLSRPTTGTSCTDFLSVFTTACATPLCMVAEDRAGAVEAEQG